MCGRFVVSGATADLLSGLLPDPLKLANNWNVAPTTQIAIVREWEGARVQTSARWGFIPGWAKQFEKQRPQPINAKIENLTSSGMWRGPFKSHRCVIPAAGYYEWTVTDTGKQPHFIHAPGVGLAMAGLVGAWADPDKADDDPDKWRLSTAIITRDSHVAPGEVHDRMPACLTEDSWDGWLSDELGPDELTQLLDESSHQVAEKMVHYEVSREVNSVRNKGPQLIEPLS